MNKISLDIDSGIRMIYPYRSNKGLNPKFPEGHPDRQTLEEAQRVEQMKHCDNNNKDEICLNVYNNILVFILKPPQCFDCVSSSLYQLFCLLEWCWTRFWWKNGHFLLHTSHLELTSLTSWDQSPLDLPTELMTTCWTLHILLCLRPSWIHSS